MDERLEVGCNKLEVFKMKQKGRENNLCRCQMFDELQ